MVSLLTKSNACRNQNVVENGNDCNYFERRQRLCVSIPPVP